MYIYNETAQPLLERLVKLNEKLQANRDKATAAAEANDAESVMRLVLDDKYDNSLIRGVLVQLTDPKYHVAS